MANPSGQTTVRRSTPAGAAVQCYPAFFAAAAERVLANISAVMLSYQATLS
jgi:hypothetical protein